MAMAIAFIVILIAAPVTTAMQYVVGDEVGWSATGDYSFWAAGKTFNIGDTIVFNYDSNLHSVVEVTQDYYATCMNGDALNYYKGGHNIITLDKPGPIYFICPTPGHCVRMKLAINVVGPVANPPPEPPVNNSTPSIPAGLIPNGVPNYPLNPPYNTTSGAAGMNKELMVGFSLLLGSVLW